LLDAVLTDGYACGVGDVFEMASAVVSINVIGLAVVGDKEIEMTVLIEIRPDSG
jgi:hypothetical protein